MPEVQEVTLYSSLPLCVFFADSIQTKVIGSGWQLMLHLEVVKRGIQPGDCATNVPRLSNHCTVRFDKYESLNPRM